MSEACCRSSSRLLNTILLNEWGFEGYVVSDCGAISDIYTYHRVVETASEAAALAVQSGCDLNCGRQCYELLKAVEEGLIAEEEIDVSLKRLFWAYSKKNKLGEIGV